MRRRSSTHRDTPSGPRRRIAPLSEIDWEQHLADASGDTSRLSFVSGLLLGLVVGIVVALALAPQEGTRTRRQVRETTIELGARARVPRRTRVPDETLADAGEKAEVELRRRLSEGEY